MNDPVVVGGEPGDISYRSGQNFDSNATEISRSSRDENPPYTITVSDVSQRSPAPPRQHRSNGGYNDHRTKNLRGPSGNLTIPMERSSSPYRDPSRDHSESPRPSVSPGSSTNSFPSYDWETLDPESNLYIANFSNDFGEENLRNLFMRYGPIARAKFVPVQGQRAYGFVQFVNVEDAHRALKEMDGYRLPSGEQLFMSVALRKRSSLSEEPTNLYVKNIPESWTYHELNVLFGPFGRIVQSRVAGDRIAFVRYETHFQAIQAIDSLNGRTINGAPAALEVKFANRKRAVKEYNNPTPVHKSNSNNLYVRGLPPSFAQIQLEELFAVYGTVSSTRMFPHGVAFVRFAERESALGAIQHLHNQIIPGCTTPLTVKLAYFDIGDSRNRTWKRPDDRDNEPRERPARSGRSRQHHSTHHSHPHSSHQPQHIQGGFGKNIYPSPFPTTHYSGPASQAQSQVGGYAAMGPMHPSAAFPPMNGGLAPPNPYGQLVVSPIPVSTSPGLSVPATIQSPPSPGAPGASLSSPISPQHSQSQTNMAPATAPVSPIRPQGPSQVFNGHVPYQLDPNLVQPFQQMTITQPAVLTSPDGQPLYAAPQAIISPITTVQPTVFLTPTTTVQPGASPHAQLVPSPQAVAMSGSITPSRAAPAIPVASLGTTVVQQQQRQFSEQQRRQGDIIYQVISEKYPKYASKVTGMILNLGIEEAERLLTQRAELDKKVEEAVRILQAVEQNIPGGAQLVGATPLQVGGLAGETQEAVILPQQS